MHRSQTDEESSSQLVLRNSQIMAQGVPHSVPAAMGIDELFECQAARTPHAIAVAFLGEEITYRELSERSNLLAGRLRASGVRHETLVAICVERSVEMVVGLLGILKAGGAYLPLDPAHLKSRLAFMLEDAKPAVVLTQKKLLPDLPPHEAKIVCLDALDESRPELENVDDATAGRTVGDLAYVIYTSGSTGRPKGVEISHRAVLNFLASMREEPGMEAADTLLAVTTLSFDIAVLELFLPLTVGARVVIATREVATDGVQLAACMAECGATVMQATPATWRMLLDAGWQGSPGLKILCGGEAWSADLAGELLKRCRSLWNMYGPTETTIWSAVAKVEPGKAVRIGAPIANTTFHVLDDDRQPVTNGSPGELCIGGDGLARGYLNRPGLTGERFVKDPFDGEHAGRLYRTGDLVCRKQDGTFEFLGRVDQQVKIRGFRVELGEIESALREHPAVRDAVVASREEVEADVRLVAYVIWKDGAQVSSAELRKFLEAKLPSYMLPAAFVALRSLPLTPNGKLDRSALPAPDWEQVRSGEDYVAPRGEVEEAIAGIWRDVFGGERIGIHDNFFELGGHSLLATRVISRVREKFHAGISLRDFFEAPTISEFAVRLRDLPRARAASLAPPITPVSREQPIPLSFAQERLWFLDQLGSSGAAYSLPMRIRLAGPLDAVLLRLCVDELVRRHESLRSKFTVVDGQPVQVIGQGAPCEIPVIDLSGLPAREREQEVVRLCEVEARIPFDLTQDCTPRLRVFRFEQNDHILFLNVHHIFFDDWSAEIFLRELGQLYEAHGRGERSPLGELGIQYGDYAAWQRQWMSGEVLEEQLGYWSKQLEGAPAVLELPYDRARPAVQSWHGGMETARYPKELLEGLKTLSRREGVSLFMTLLAAFDVLLWRYSGQEDIVVATPIAGRSRKESEGLIGFFVNTLVMRSDCSREPAFRELLERLKEVALGAYAHQDLPFEKLVEALRPERSLSYNPLCQVLFALQNTGLEEVKFNGVGARVEAVDSGSAKFDLSVSMNEQADGLKAVVEYSTDLFDSDTILRLLTHFRILLEAVVADPGRRIGELALMGEAERRQLLVEWNETAEPDERKSCAHELFEEQVEKTPEAVAVMFEEQRLSYLELNQRANQLAHQLRSIGVGPEVKVAVCLGPSIDLAVGFLGILKAGGAYLPLDPAYPQERLSFMMNDADVSILLTQKSLRSKLPANTARVISLDADWDGISKRESHNPVATAIADNLAYVIYTSGSTGQPKGVLLEHRGLSNVCAAQLRAFKLRPEDRVLQFASISFDASVFEMVMALCSGATLCLGSREELMPGPDLTRFLREKAVTVVTLPPSALAALPLEPLPSLRLVTVAGESCPAELVERWAPGRQFFNLYGPTEATIWASMEECTPGRGAPSIGRPILNTQLYVLGRAGDPVPVGVKGELCIGGVGVARGYLKRPELTADKFIPDPFLGRPGARLYKTGDLARWLPDGKIQFLGRSDHQVKIRGFRIELGEIESALRQHPEVRDVVAVPIENPPGQQRIVACVACGTGGPDADELRAVVQKTLPEYMVPSGFVFLDALPLMPNGKVDRRALLAAAQSGAASAEDYIAPQTEQEKRLAEIFSELLGVGRVGAADNFFQMGGHSLLAARLVSRLRDELQVELPLRSVFENQTVRTLAIRIAELEALEETKRTPLLPPIQRVRREGSLPLSFAQERLWFLDMLEPNNAVYNIPVALRLDGELDAGLLQRALEEVVQRQEILRTRFSAPDGRPVQVVAPDAGVEIPLTDLSGLAEQERMAEANRLCTEEAQRSFDLTKDLMLRVRLIRLSSTAHILFLNMHHIASDGWSIGVLIRELGQLYAAFSQGKRSPLPELAIQYSDFAVWQREWLRGEILQKQFDYWKEKLHGAPALLQLPTDRPRPAEPSYRGAVETTVFAPSLLTGLKTLARTEGASLFMVLLAAFEALLHRYTGEDDLVVGSPVAGRNQTETEGLIGFFVNTLLLRSDLSGNPTFREVLRRAKEAALGAYAHQDLPFEKLVQELNPERHPSYNPLCQVVIALQDAPLESMKLGNLSMSLREVSSATSKFDLSVSMVEQGDGLEASVEYSTDLFDRETIVRLLNHFRTLLEAVVANPEERIASLPLLTAAERHQLLVEWNDTRVDYPADVCLHQLFEAQVERTPDAVAVVFEDQRLTYRELDQRANQVANHLRALGVGVETFVGVCMERSIEMVVALYGTLKAGAAYVPIDPGYPRERVSFMMEDASASVILTSGKLRDKLPPHRGRVIDLDAERELIGRQSKEPPLSSVGSGNLAYMIYTSGSTGRPKGAMNTHRGICNRLLWMQDAYGLRAEDRVLQKTPFSFDVSVWEFFWPLMTGAGLVVARPEGHRDSAYLVKLIQEREITTLHFVPSMLRLFLEERGVEDCRSLRRVICSGEALDCDLQERFFSRLPSVELHNLYGPTEAAVDVTAWRCRPQSGLSIVPIGKPIANMQTYVLDSHLQPVPVGVAGELHLGGVGLARGYHKRPELTAEKFIPSPFSAKPGARLYKTGDRVRHLPDGNLEYLGRLDYQVKIRGNRIELGEIETVLAQHPGVRLAVATVLDDPVGGKRIAAYFAVHAGRRVSIAELRETLRERLPDYMVPSSFVLLDAMPLTPSGKIDRNTLPEPGRSNSDTGEEFVAPRDTLETRIAQVWENLLRISPISVKANFFDLGGHSLLAVRLIGEINQALSIHLSVAEIFRAPTVETMAAVIRSGDDSETQVPGLIAVRPGNRRRPIFWPPSIGAVERFVECRHLAELLDEEGAFHAFVPTPEISEIGALAEHCIRLMRLRQPRGPYALVGWCQCGHVAYEIARQLTMQGEEIELLAVIEASARDFAPTARQKLFWLREKLCGEPRVVYERVKTAIQRRRKASTAGRAVKKEPHLDTQFIEHETAARRHFATPFAGRIVLVRSEQALRSMNSEKFGWEALVPFVEVHTIPCEHSMMLQEPAIHYLAEILRQYLRRSGCRLDFPENEESSKGSREREPAVELIS